MEPSFCAQLQTAGIHADIIAFLGNDKNQVYSITRFANFIDQRSEIQSHILNHVAACKDDRGQRATLCELWREADIAEQHRLENKAKGLSQNDFVEPLPIRRARWVLWTSSRRSTTTAPFSRRSLRSRLWDG